MSQRAPSPEQKAVLPEWACKVYHTEWKTALNACVHAAKREARLWEKALLYQIKHRFQIRIVWGSGRAAVEGQGVRRGLSQCLELHHSPTSGAQAAEVCFPQVWALGVPGRGANTRSEAPSLGSRAAALSLGALLTWPCPMLLCRELAALSWRQGQGPHPYSLILPSFLP